MMRLEINLLRRKVTSSLFLVVALLSCQ
ncbi:hypothetical protein Ccrd_018452 [Cynara cardunculus var. scolymus]|uniref:Uncharacterized protein n=1 Tax=Cynara cardunculus var. scolymus TaxID=59895 RepID=A0A103Y674_CYNCS|nr:hypothetical protein Ccrd_018452 [Cynara cardunculus var. scolymus]